MFLLFSSSVSTFSASGARVADPDAHGSASFWGSWDRIWIIRVKRWIRIRIRITVKTLNIPFLYQRRRIRSSSFVVEAVPPLKYSSLKQQRSFRV
jgi:hypothetical protein